MSLGELRVYISLIAPGCADVLAPLITYLKAIDSLAAAGRPRGIACLAKSRCTLA